MRGTCWSSTDGIQFGAYHVLAAVGVDTEGKHVLGVTGGRERERRW